MAKSDDINQKVDEKTGFGTYVAKDLKTTAMLLGGMAAGAGLGYLATKSKGIVTALKSVTEWVGRRFKNKETADAIKDFADSPHLAVVLPIIGAGVGSFAAAIPNTYEHWKEAKKQQLRVEEMAEDVVALREQRNTAMNTLREQAASIKSQNEAIKKILDHGPKGHHALTANVPPEDKVSRVEQHNKDSAEPHRG